MFLSVKRSFNSVAWVAIASESELTDVKGFQDVHGYELSD